MRLVVAAAAVSLLVVASAACGGGGGGSTGVTPPPTPTLELFDGTYTWLFLEGDMGPPLENMSMWGTVTADGLGMVTDNLLIRNDAGSLIGPTTIPAFSYKVSSTQRLQWGTTSHPLGGVSLDGHVATLVPTADGVPPSLSILLRRTGTFTATDLEGTYHACAFFTVAGVDSIWFSGVVTFDAAGNATLSNGVNNNGFVTPPGAPIPYGTATIAPSGAVTWASPTPQVVWSGGMLASGELVVLAGTTEPSDAQFLIVLLRQGTGLSDVTFSGSYHVASFGVTSAPLERYVALTGTCTADGAGSFIVDSATFNRDGVVASGGPLPPFPYLIAPDGTLSTVVTAAAGAVSQSGDFVMFSGGTTAGSSPVLWFFHR